MRQGAPGEALTVAARQGPSRPQLKRAR